MAHLISDITKYLRFDERNIDNWLFKLFHKGCVAIFLTGSLVGIVSQYFGEPIRFFINMTRAILLEYFKAYTDQTDYVFFSFFSFFLI